MEEWGIKTARDNRTLERLWQGLTEEYSRRSGTEVERKRLRKWYADHKYRTKRNRRMEEGWNVDMLLKIGAGLSLVVAVFCLYMEF